METLTDFIFLDSKITADGKCSHEIERRLFLGRKAITNLDSLLKSRDITLPTKFHLVKAMNFPVVIYGCESWTIKKAEHQRIDAFDLWCWRRLLRVPWTCKEIKPVHPKGNQSWIFIGRMMLKLKLQYFGTWCEELTHWKRPWCWERLKAEGEEDENVGWHHWLYGCEFEQTLGVGNGQGSLVCCSPLGCKESGMTE